MLTKLAAKKEKKRAERERESAKGERWEKIEKYIYIYRKRESGESNSYDNKNDDNLKATND